MSSDSSDDNYDGGDAVRILPMPHFEDTFPDIPDPSYAPPPPKTKKKETTPNGDAEESEKPKKEKVDTSKLDIKFVDQTWDLKRHNWSSKDVDRSHVLNTKAKKSKKPIVVIRRQFGIAEGNRESIKTYIDIKSASLLDLLRTVLEDVKSISLRGKHPTLRLDILYAFLPDLKAHFDNATEPDQQSDGFKHLQQLNEFLESWYQSIDEELAQLLEHGEITYELLWAIFKPNGTIFTNDQDTEQPRCLLYDFGDYVDRKGHRYFEMACRSLHYDGKFFGEIQTFLKISEFRGARKIRALEVYPLKHHKDPDQLRSELVQRGRKAISLMGVVHCEFKGLAFYRMKGKAVKIHMKGRTMIDAASFREFNANYASVDDDPDDPEFYARRLDERRRLQTQNLMKKQALQVDEVTDDEAFLCGPAVQGFNLGKRTWAEFTVSGIYDITWNDVPFDALVLPSKKKDLLQALIQQTTSELAKEGEKQVKPFDDFVDEKGQGLVILLHGSPGVGKTLTAEAVSEYQKRPLYRVSAGDLDLDAQKLENKLVEILDLATRWKAIVLLDEADVFVESRSLHSLHHNTLVSVFLRQLEYFQGVLILTTNRLTVFDEAVKSRIHLGIKYEDLNQKARATIWKSFLERADTTTEEGLKSTVTERQILELSQRPSNGRQIKNCVRISHALAASKNEALGYAHLINALDANEDFDNEHRGIGLPPNAVNSYL